MSIEYRTLQLSVNGYIGFATVLDQGPTINIGPETDWPRLQDPAMIAPYLCKQQVDYSHVLSIYRIPIRFLKREIPVVVREFIIVWPFVNLYSEENQDQTRDWEDPLLIPVHSSDRAHNR